MNIKEDINNQKNSFISFKMRKNNEQYKNNFDDVSNLLNKTKGLQFVKMAEAKRSPKPQ